MSEVEFEPRKIDAEFNEMDLDIEFEDEHFHARKDIDEDYQLLLEQSTVKHKYWLSDYALRRVRMNQNYIILIVGQVGCQPKGSKVLMSDGSWKNVEDVVVGDEVVSPQHDGKKVKTKVIETYCYPSPCFDLREYSSSAKTLYTCSANHVVPYLTNDINHAQAQFLNGQIINTLNSDMDTVRAKVVPNKIQMVYGFQLDSPSQWFITDNEIITHNSGKSYSGMGLAEDIDPYFNVDRIIFHPVDFIELLDQGLPKGSVILWEEVGVSLSSRDWYKEQNKIISSLFETFRRHNLILIMTVPFVKFIDSRIRSMIHGFAEMIDPTFTGGKFGWLKYFHVVVDNRSGKIRHRYPRIRDDEGQVQIIQGTTYDQGNMRFNLPNKDLLPAYEQKKLDFVQWQQQSGLEKFRDKKDAPTIEIKDFISLLTENPRKFKLIQKEDTKESLTNLIEHNWVLFKLDYPDYKFQKKDMVSALRFVLSSYDYKFKGANKSIQDNEIGTVIKLMDLVGEHQNTINQVSKMLNTSNHTLTKKVKEWKNNGMWEEWLAEVNGDPEEDDNKDKKNNNKDDGDEENETE